MTFALVILIAIVSYLLGSFPSGLVAGKLVRGEDIRRYGSGRLGATNTFRALGPWAAVAVGLADILKGAAPVLVVGAQFHNAELQAIAGLAAIAGHNWPVFAGFRGGRGTSTSWGVLAAMDLLLALPVLAIFIATLIITRYASLASLLGAFVAIPLFAFGYFVGLIPAPFLIYAVIGSTLIVIRHRDNIERLRAGTERRLGVPVEKSSP